MNEFVTLGLTEYRKQRAARTAFLNHANGLAALLRLHENSETGTGLLMLTPLLEVSWVDGKIGNYEQDSILETAEIYGLLETTNGYAEVMDRLCSRPHPRVLDSWWKEIESIGLSLPPARCAAMASYLLQQTRYIAGLGQSHVYGLWRGYRSGEAEMEALEATSKKISELKGNAKTYDKAADSVKNDVDILNVLPLVKVAWADGQISKRERRMIFDSAFELGVKPSADNIERLAGWLKLSPKEDFLLDGIALLGRRLRNSDPDDLAKKKYDLLSRCTLIAEASGGSGKTQSGGPRISSEEFHAVKQIASILNIAINADATKTAKPVEGR